MAASTRGEPTRRLILDTALRLFREQSYERTTMRAIAAEAGVSVGNAYYYFAGKDELVQAFYLGIQDEHRQRVAARTPPTAGIAARLGAVLHTGLDVMAPHHRFAASFVRVAVDPRSPASPFSAQSAASRAAAVGLFRDVVAGTGGGTPELREALPELLWLAYLGITLFWVYDDSPDQARTRGLVDRLCPLVERLVRMSRLPGVRAVVTEVLDVVASVRR